MKLYLRIYYKEDKMNLANFFSDAIYIVFEPNEIKTKKIKQFLDYIHGDISDEDIQDILEFIYSGKYFAGSLYIAVFSSFQCLIHHGIWNEALAKAYHEYLVAMGWDYELEIVGKMLSEGDIESVREFCLDSKLADEENNTYFMTSTVWRGKDYSK